MSTKLLRRLLLQTSGSKESHTHKTDEVANKKKRKQQNEDDLKPVDSDEIMKYQVQSMMLLDSRMASRGSRKNQSEKRISAKLNRDSKIRKKSTNIVLGNSRGASSALRQRPKPTFDRKQFLKKKEEKRLKSIAKLLKKNSSRKK
jgi:23S rRNA pseudoU1915 N3-methylase RlmH